MKLLVKPFYYREIKFVRFNEGGNFRNNSSDPYSIVWKKRFLFYIVFILYYLYFNYHIYPVEI